MRRVEQGEAGRQFRPYRPAAKDWTWKLPAAYVPGVQFRRWIPYVAALVVVASTYVWTVASNRRSLEWGSPQNDYYNLLVRGMVKGQLSLDAEVPEALLSCPDPYDPAQRPDGVALHDASLYRGKYYIYYGVVPAVVLLLPFRLVAGFGLPLPVAILGFALATYVIGLRLLERIRWEHYPRTPGWLAFLVAVAFGFVGGMPVLLRRSSMYELPISAGAFFALLGIALLLRAVTQEATRGRWLALASLCAGLAVGCRPTYLLAAAAFVLGSLWSFARPGRTPSRRRSAEMVVAIVLPIATVGLLLAWYNYARFGSPTEFGVSYILSGVYESKIEHFRPRYVLWNLYAYLFAPVEWGRYFPFVREQAIELARPLQHFGMDHPFGLLLNLPFFWLGTIAVAEGWRRRAEPGFGPARALVGALLTAALGTAAMLMGFYAAMARYVGDFGPGLSLLAGIGCFAAAHRVGAVRARSLRVATWGALSAVALFSATVALLFSVQLYGRLRDRNPAAYASLGRWLNEPVHWIERSGGERIGALRFQLAFPTDPVPGAREELVRTGFGRDLDRLWVRYPDKEHVEFEFEHAGAPALRSAPIRRGTGVQSIDLQLGSLAPPATWGGYAGWSDGERAAVLRRLQVKVDGATVLDRLQRFYDASPGTVIVGGGDGSPEFTGRIAEVVRVPLRRPERGPQSPPAIAPDENGVWRFEIRFPEGRGGSREPLIVSGETGRGDFLVVEYLGSERFRLLYDHWGSQSKFGPERRWESGRAYAVEISHPGYAADSVGPVNDPQPLRVRIDGEEYWQVRVPMYHAAAEDRYLGFNPIGGSSCGERFNGVISQRDRAN